MLLVRDRRRAMPLANVRGVNINYKVLGDHGPWVALSPGGRRDLGGVEPLAKGVADAGHRVVIFDRRNCGASEVVIDGEDSEYEMWADDLHDLLAQLKALPVFVGGADLPVIGATEAEIKSIKVPACIIPGNDNTHGRQTGENLARILANAEVHILFPKHYDMDLSPREEWDEKAGEMAALFADFIKRTAMSGNA